MDELMAKMIARYEKIEYQPYPEQTKILLDEAEKRGMVVRPSFDIWEQLECARATIVVYDREYDHKKSMKIHLSSPYNGYEFDMAHLPGMFDIVAKTLGYTICNG